MTVTDRPSGAPTRSVSVATPRGVRRRHRARPAGTPRWWGTAAGGLAAASLLVVTALWASNGGGAELLAGGWPALSTLGRLVGLWASNLLLIQVLLMARVPWVERAFGQDRLARWHRWTGFTSFHLMVAHVGLITVGYAGPARADVVDTFVKVVTNSTGMLLAAAGTAMLVLVVATSIRMARRRLRYESWHLLHLYAYLGVGLALPHQLSSGSDFIATPAAGVYWWTMWGLAAASVLAFRVGLPLWRTLWHRVEVAEVVSEGPGLTSVLLRGRHLDRLPARSGQFFLWRFLDGPGWSRAHPFSLSAPPRADLLRITVKQVGDGSRRIARLRPGTRVMLEGPYGRLTGDAYRGGPVTMLACGIGITPLLALLWDLPYRPGTATLLYRARSNRELAFGSELEWLARHRGVRVVPLLGPRAERASWLPATHAHRPDADALRAIVPDVAGHDLYVCGPDAWTEAVRAAVRTAGVPADRVHVERFAW